MKTKTVIAGIAAVGLVALILKDQKSRKSKPDLFLRASLPGNFNAITVPPIGIFVRADKAFNRALLEHELVHWQQYQRMGLVKYYATYLSQYLGDGYDRMAMELEARGRESAYCRENYTQCVRDGVARTVNNPRFRS